LAQQQVGPRALHRAGDLQLRQGRLPKDRQLAEAKQGHAKGEVPQAAAAAAECVCSVFFGKFVLLFQKPMDLGCRFGGSF